MGKEKTISEVNEILWEIYKRKFRAGFELFITDPNPITYDGLKYPNDRSKIEHTKDS